MIVNILISIKWSTLQHRLIYIPFVGLISSCISLLISILIESDLTLSSEPEFITTYLQLGKACQNTIIPILAIAPLGLCLELCLVGLEIKLSTYEKSQVLTPY